MSAHGSGSLSAHPAIREFCQSLGVRPTPLPVVLHFERTGQVQIEEADGQFSVLLARPVSAHDRGVAPAALRAVHPDRGLPYTVRAAFRGEDTLVFVSRVTPERMDVSTLDELIRLLSRLADEATAA